MNNLKDTTVSVKLFNSCEYNYCLLFLFARNANATWKYFLRKPGIENNEIVERRT